jgi:hypothetical protein
MSKEKMRRWQFFFKKMSSVPLAKKASSMDGGLQKECIFNE